MTAAAPIVPYGVEAIPEGRVQKYRQGCEVLPLSTSKQHCISNSLSTSKLSPKGHYEDEEAIWSENRQTHPPLVEPLTVTETYSVPSGNTPVQSYDKEAFLLIVNESPRASPVVRRQWDQELIPSKEEWNSENAGLLVTFIIIAFFCIVVGREVLKREVEEYVVSCFIYPPLVSSVPLLIYSKPGIVPEDDKIQHMISMVISAKVRLGTAETTNK